MIEGVIEDKVGSGSTDFWGISFYSSANEQDPMDDAALERGIARPGGMNGRC